MALPSAAMSAATLTAQSCSSPPKALRRRGFRFSSARTLYHTKTLFHPGRRGFRFSVGADGLYQKTFFHPGAAGAGQCPFKAEQREAPMLFRRQPPLNFLGTTFFLAQKEVWAAKPEQKLPFTKSEYEISLLLAKNHGQIYSKEQIFENQVFGYDKESDVSAITEHIKNIRKKLAAVDLSPIETIWGIGYRWNRI